MRLWHHKLIPVLPRQLLIELHRECCALRGRCWGKKHSTINYVFHYNWEILFNYHTLVISEMKNRGYNPNPIWMDFFYRGKNCSPLDPKWQRRLRYSNLFPEHNINYLTSCCKLIIKKFKKLSLNKCCDDNELYRFYAWMKENNIK